MSNIITIMGVDPGLENTGYGVIYADADTGRIKQGPHGMITTSNKFAKSDRLTHIYRCLTQKAEQYQPDYTGIEQYFVSTRKKNNYKKVATYNSQIIDQQIKPLTFTDKQKMSITESFDPNAQIMNQVIGVAILALSPYQLEEFTPSQAKKAVTGNGRADKEQMQLRVAQLLGCPSKIRPNHVADAFAMAITRWQMLPESRGIIGPLFGGGF